MKVTLLVDNNTIIDRYFHGEPGLSFLIEEEGKKILFDVGYSDIFIKNAQKMNISMYDIDYVAISHGHSDHTWGLVPLITLYNEACIEKLPFKKPVLLAHKEAFSCKLLEDALIGSIVTEEALRRCFRIDFRKEPFWITEKLVFLGEIERTSCFENRQSIGKYIHNGKEEDDYLRDDTALAYKSKEGLVIITGCSHSGICNIIEYSKKLCGEEKVADVIGGLHLLNPSDELLDLTKEYFRQAGVKRLHACHCTDLRSRMALSEVTEVFEAGVGLKLEYE